MATDMAINVMRMYTYKSMEIDISLNYVVMDIYSGTTVHKHITQVVYRRPSIRLQWPMVSVTVVGWLVIIRSFSIYK